MYKALALFMIAAGLSACSTTPLPVSQTTTVPSEFVLSDKYAAAGEGTQTITVVRNAGSFTAGGGSRYFVAVDGIRIASLDPAEHVKINLSKGEHVLSVSSAVSPSDVLQSVVIAVPTKVSLYRIDSSNPAPLQPSFE